MDTILLLRLRVTRITQQYNGVKVTTEDGTNYFADACIITVPLGVLKANIIKFEPELNRPHGRALPWRTSVLASR
ncbi:unnamed protein product [Urochloa humidicola]